MRSRCGQRFTPPSAARSGARQLLPFSAMVFAGRVGHRDIVCAKPLAGLGGLGIDAAASFAVVATSVPGRAEVSCI